MVKNVAGVASLIEAAQLNVLFSRARLVFLINVVNASIAAVFLWGVVPSGLLLTWWLAIAGITVARFRLLLDYERDAARAERMVYWKRIAVWGAGVSGAIWGAAAIILFPTDLSHQAFLLVVIVGMLAGAVVSWNAWFPAFQAYFLAVALLTLIRFALGIFAGDENRDIFAALGAMFMVFTIGLYILAQKSNQMLSQMLFARFEKEQSDDRYRTLFLRARIPMLLIDPSDGQIMDANAAASDYYGYPVAQMVGMNIDRINTLPRAEIAEKMDRANRQQENGFHFKHRLASGEVRDVEVYTGPIRMGEQQLLYSIVHDITERMQAEKSMELAALIYQASSEAIMVTDENNRIVEINPAFTRITGYELDEVIGKDSGMLNSGVHDREFYRLIWQDMLDAGYWQGEMWEQRKNGEIFAKWTSISVIRHPDGSVYRHVVQFSDITEKKQKDEIIWRQANYDMLTGLPNRRLFRDRLEREIRQSRRTDESLALLFIDLDHFKEINDTMGHDMGDRLLVEAALRIGRCVRETDTVARLGGDEFTVILSAFGNCGCLERIVLNIIGELCKPFMLGSEAAYVSASVGIALCPEDAQGLEELLKKADRAMYGAKAKGRNCFAYFTESMQSEAQEKLVLTNDLRGALARNELEVYYQPIVEMAGGQIAKAEALLRWKHRERGMIAPDLFIPLAEESGLILEIGEWVFGQAADSVGRWREKFGEIIPVSVNKSPVQFIAKAVGEEWPDRLASQGLPRNSIAVEITEGMLLEELPMVKQRLQIFRDGGIEIAVDDFGTGFSSLSYLRKFDVDYLKIDRSFISNLAENESDKALVEAIIVMAHKLGIRTIAEGVETERQHELLVSFGCDFAQGYLYSRPVPAEEFERLVEKQMGASLGETLIDDSRISGYDARANSPLLTKAAVNY